MSVVGDGEIVTIGGLPTHPVSRTHLAEAMVRDCLLGRKLGNDWVPKMVFSSNGQGVALAGRDAQFKAAMLKADIVHGDGQSIVFASKFTGTPLPERVATTDFFHDAARIAEVEGLRFYILGGSFDLNRRAVEAIRAQYPNLKISGARDGYFQPEDEQQICEDIVRAGTDVLWVGLGKPFQEHWCVRNAERLKGVGWMKTCGGLYAFLAGDSPRAPGIMQDLGLEWLFRTWREPRRLAWRYLTTNPYSLYQLVTRTNFRRQS